MDSSFLAFLGVAVLVTITPGADMALVTKHALAYGRRAALQAVAGIMTGLIVWAALTVAGLAALLTASATAFTVLKIAGGIYLVYLGLQTLWQARLRADDPGVETVPVECQTLTGRQAYRQGLLSNLVNPKVGAFYATLLPQFVAVGESASTTLALLAFVHIVMGIAWLTWYVQMVVMAGQFLRRPVVRRWLDHATGAVLVALGLRLVTEQR